MEIGDTIKLIPKTRHGKNRVHQHGDIAEVVGIKESMFSVKTPDGDWRWIDRWNDSDENFSWKIMIKSEELS